MSLIKFNFVGHLYNLVNWSTSRELMCHHLLWRSSQHPGDGEHLCTSRLALFFSINIHPLQTVSLLEVIHLCTKYHIGKWERQLTSSSQDSEECLWSTQLCTNIVTVMWFKNYITTLSLRVNRILNWTCLEYDLFSFTILKHINLVHSKPSDTLQCSSWLCNSEFVRI